MSMLTANEDLDPLTKLAIKHGTDKWGPHFYTPVYHKLFSHLRDRSLRLLEIGIGGYSCKTIGGASLAMWADYFPSAEITGIDIAEKQVALGPRTMLFRGSQDDPLFLKKVCEERGPFDIIIDDGSHICKHVVASFHILFPELANPGIYVIEDVQTAFWPQFGGSILHGGAPIKMAQTLIEYLNHAEIAVVDPARSMPDFAKQVRALHVYHNIIAIEKSDNREPSNFAYDLSNPHASRAVRAIEQELERSPTAEGLANLIDLYSSGGNHAKAKELTETLLAKWPSNPTGLLAAFQAAARRGDAAGKVIALERLLQIEPDNVALRGDLERARSELLNPSQPERG
jgi:hypothetical protein